MNSRQRPSPRPSRPLFTSLEHLEHRRHLSGVCGCGVCQAGTLVGAASASLVEATQPLVHALRAADDVAGAVLADAFSGLASVGTAPTPEAVELVKPTAYTPFAVNFDALIGGLAGAPTEFTAEAEDAPLTVALPAPDGTFERFSLVESSIMEPALAAEFPGIKTFAGQGLDDPTASVRLDYTPLGFHAQVLSAAGAWYIDPYFNRATPTHVSYYRADLSAAEAQRAWNCTVIADQGPMPEDAPTASRLAEAPAFGTQLRTYRAAVAATGEYTAFFGGTVSAGQSAIVTAMNRVTGIYEKELAIRMTLVANNNLLVFTNAGTDPYSNFDGGLMLGQNQTTVDSTIGSANYEIGHVFSTGGGGVAGLGVVGRTGQEARGVTGLPSPTGDAFYVDYVAHEMGHQFGANHTFNQTSSNRNGPTAYEPGSGSTIMAYAGLFGSTGDVQPNSDPYFHSASIDEIYNYAFLGAGNVVAPTATGNTAPTVNAGADFVIPANTPFALTAVGSDPNGDAITYDWQQRDLGASGTLQTADNGASPLFRALPPSTSPTRLFPRLSSILSGANSTTNGTSGSLVERLPTVARASMDFRVLARDNRAGGGGVSSDDMFLQVVNTGAAFSITSFNTAATLPGGSTQTVNWNVAGTTANGINAASVNIKLSLDGGNTFPITLAGNVPNDGSESFQVPYSTASTTARIKVEPTGNVFFDINNAALTITNVAPPSSPQPGQPQLAVGSDTGTSTTDRLTRLNNSSTASRLSFTVGNTLAGATLRIYAGTKLIGTGNATAGTSTVTTDGDPVGDGNVTTLADGDHVITITQQNGTAPVSAASLPLTITVDATAPTLTGAPAFAFQTAPHRVTGYGFSEAVSNTLAAGDFSAILRRLNEPDAAVALSLNMPTSSSAELSFPGTANGALADGDYRVSLNAAGVTDDAGNPLSAGNTLDFFFYNGDASRDRNVGFADLLILRANYGKPSGALFTEGDFTFDGAVGFADLLLLRGRYGSSLPMPSAPRPGDGSLFGGGGDDEGGGGVITL